MIPGVHPTNSVENHGHLIISAESSYNYVIPVEICGDWLRLQLDLLSNSLLTLTELVYRN